TSSKVGTSWSILFPSLGIKLAASTGKTAFFAPSTLTLPFSLFPPFTTILSICQFSFNICSVYLYSSLILLVQISTTILVIYHFFCLFLFQLACLLVVHVKRMFINLQRE